MTRLGFAIALSFALAASLFLGAASGAETSPITCKYKWDGGAGAVKNGLTVSELTGRPKANFVWHWNNDLPGDKESMPDAVFLARAPGGLWIFVAFVTAGCITGYATLPVEAMEALTAPPRPQS